jgi:hypothetical protein
MYSDNSPYSILEITPSIEPGQPARQIHDYSQFNPRKYINEYYSKIGEENRFLLEFYHKIYKEVSSEATLLEFGGGPTIYQLISAAQNVKEIVFAEYLECNRKEVSSWIKAEQGSVNWDEYLDYVLELDYQVVSDKNRRKLRDSLINKITAIIECNAYLPEVLISVKHKQFDIVSSGFCLECISSSEKDFTGFIKKVTTLVKKDGQLVMTLLKNSEFYTINQLSFPTFPIDEEYINNLLAELGFREIRIETIKAEHDQGYEGIIALTARRN